MVRKKRRLKKKENFCPYFLLMGPRKTLSFKFLSCFLIVMWCVHRACALEFSGLALTWDKQQGGTQYFSRCLQESTTPRKSNFEKHWVQKKLNALVKKLSQA